MPAQCSEPVKVVCLEVDPIPSVGLTFESSMVESGRGASGIFLNLEIEGVKGVDRAPYFC